MINRADRGKIFREGIFLKNPLITAAIGICPALAVTTRAVNGFCLGLAVTITLLFTSILFSALKRVLPHKTRIPALMLMTSTFVTLFGLYLRAYFPGAYERIGMFMPLMAANCIVLERFENFFSKNSIISSAVDAVSTGIGYMAALSLLGAVRELFGSENIHVFGRSLPPMLIFLLAPGGLFVLGVMIASMNKLTGRNAEHRCDGCSSASVCTLKDKGGCDKW